jgi:2-acylglycerol O-acyltransferase 2
MLCVANLWFNIWFKVPLNTAPSEQEVDEMHAQYLKALSELFEEHKARLGFPELELELI